MKKYDEVFECAKIALKIPKELESIYELLPAMFKEVTKPLNTSTGSKKKKKVSSNATAEKIIIPEQEQRPNHRK
jgi:hypothetical protein